MKYHLLLPKPRLALVFFHINERVIDIVYSCTNLFAWSYCAFVCVLFCLFVWPSLCLPGFYARECLSQQKPNLCGTTAARSLSDSVSDTAVARPLGHWLCLLGCQIQGGLYNRSHPTHPPLLSAWLCWFTSTTSLLPTSQYIHPLLFSTPLLPYIYNKASLVMTHSSVHTVRIISLNVMHTGTCK